MKPYSFFIIKPAAMALANQIINDLKNMNIEICEIRLGQLTEAMVRIIYPNVHGLMISIIIEKEADQPCLMGKVVGKNIIRRLLQACGKKTNPLLCEAGTIRHTYGDLNNFFKVEDKVFYGNTIHRCRNRAEVKRDEQIFNTFPPPG